MEGHIPSLLRVLHVVPTLRPDGAERIAVHIVTGLDKQRFEAGLLSIGERVDSDLDHIVGEAGIQVWYLGKKLGFNPRIYPRVQDVFRAFRPEVVHTHLDVLRYTFPAMIRYKPKLMLHTVHNLAKEEMEWYGRVLQRLGYRFGIVPIAVATGVATSVERLYRCTHCRVIRNCIPTQRYSNPTISRVEWRATHGFHEREVLFVCVSRLVPQKNHLMLLKAFAEAAAIDPNVRLVLVGTGPLSASLQAAAKSMGLTDRVRFMGTRTDIADVLAAMDVFVLSSDWEGSPLSLLEAMSAGLPVISTAVGGVPEVFQNRIEGFMIRPGDTSGFSTAMLSVSRDKEARQSMGAAGAATAQKSFSVATMVKAYEAVYERARLGAALDSKDKSFSVSAPGSPVSI